MAEERNAKPYYFGHDLVADSMARRIERHFVEGVSSARHASEKALVVGVFGEWGSGKSVLLHQLSERFEHRLTEDLKRGAGDTLTLPITFNPWRYEREEHLLVPLLKSAELALRDLAAKQAEFDKLEGEFTEKIAKTVKRGSRLFGVGALSFLSMLKFKAGLPGLVEVGVNLKDGIDSAKDLLDKTSFETDDAKDDSLAPSELNSLYFEFEQRLARLTQGAEEGAEPLNLLFLIDDLDRCLPEKAVQMLESIKLFLDVPGCAFVLALDDEVVERGILHRYKEYVLNGNGSGTSVQVRPPITGAEYLEKIVHLPFRLPLPGMAEMERFLDSLPLFRVSDSETRPMRDKVRDLRGTEDSGLSRGGPAWREPLRELFLNAVPRVPRKVVRATELLELHLEMAKARGWDDCDPVTLGRLTLLQLFAPELYRYARLRYRSLLAKLADWRKGYPDHWRRDDFAEHLEKSVAPDTGQGDAAGNNEAGRTPATNGAVRERNNFHRFYCELLRLVTEARHARSAFEPLDVVVYGGQLRDDIRDWEPFFSLMEERADGGADVVASSSGDISAAVRAAAPEVHATATSSKPPRPAYREATIPDRAEFLDLLFGSSAADWDSALAGDGVRGRVLDSDTFDALMERLIGDKSYSEFPAKLDWLERLTARLTPEQLKRLYRETGLLQRLAIGGESNGSGEQGDDR